ncbi:hypothetical protein D3C74_466830 [compost metagenome]
MNGRPRYQVRFLPLPKPRSSIAVLIFSIRSILARTSGSRIDTIFFSRAGSFSLREISIPRAWAEKEIFS